MPVRYDANKIRNNFRKFANKAVEVDLAERADLVVAAAKAAVPVGKTGNLQKSIRKERFPNPEYPGWRIVADAVNENQPGSGSYALAVELGHATKNGQVGPQPYLHPALQAAKR